MAVIGLMEKYVWVLLGWILDSKVQSVEKQKIRLELPP